MYILTQEYQSLPTILPAVMLDPVANDAIVWRMHSRVLPRAQPGADPPGGSSPPPRDKIVGHVLSRPVRNQLQA